MPDERRDDVTPPETSVGQPPGHADGPGRPEVPAGGDTLLAEVRRLEAVIEERDRQILDVRTDLRIAQSTIKVQEAEIRLLTDVIARDRTRVQAETAVAAQQIAVATAPAKGRQQSDA